MGQLIWEHAGCEKNEVVTYKLIVPSVEEEDGIGTKEESNK